MNEIKTSQAGARIRSERKRLGLSQADAGQICGVTRETWGKYERNVFEMGAAPFRAFVAAGADADYIVTGINSSEFEKVAAQAMPEHMREPGKSGILSAKEEEIIACYRRADDAGRAAILAAARALAKTDNKE
ncbi:TPA: helix-turn-helix domain-containing protein [Citrobacter farmeri]